MASMRALEGQ
jgi:hypothetical protein